MASTRCARLRRARDRRGQRTATLERVEDTVALGARLGEQLRAGDVVVLSGPLGAGKTVLAKGIAAAMDVDGPVTSPTFVLARVHPPRRPGAPAMIHVDVYRLLDHASADLLGELDSLDLDTDLDDAVVVVEWGEGLAERLSDRHLDVRLERISHSDTQDRDLAVGVSVVSARPGPRHLHPGRDGGRRAADDDIAVLAERVTVDARAHAERLTPNVLAALADAALTMADLDAVVVGCGPGPFTGLRAGMATAAAYGHALGIPVHGVCSLDAIGGADHRRNAGGHRRPPARGLLGALPRRGPHRRSGGQRPGRRRPRPGAGGRRLTRARGAVRPAAMRAGLPDAGRTGGRGRPTGRTTRRRWSPLYLRRPDAKPLAARR